MKTMKEVMKKLKSTGLKAKEKRMNNERLKYRIKQFKEGVEGLQKDNFKKEDDKKDKAEGEKKEDTQEYHTEKEKNNTIDLDESKAKQEEAYKKNKANIEEVEKLKSMLPDDKFEKDYEEYRLIFIQCMVE